MNIYINAYRNKLQKIIDFGGSLNETTIRSCFIELVNNFAEEKNLRLVEELEIELPNGKKIYPDGTLKDRFRLTYGYYEAKDPKDDLNFEIDDKINKKNYPTTNTLFENSVHAVLFQNNREIYRIAMSDDEQLEKVLNSYINYERQEILEFHRAIDEFKNDIPQIVSWCREELTIANNDNKEFIERRDSFLESCRNEINPDFTIDDIGEIIIQHILTNKLFQAIFNEVEFHRENNIAKQIENVAVTFFNREKRKQFEDKNKHFYNSLEITANQITDHHEKQDFLKTLYEEFYKTYNPKEADRLGVVYTPVEIVNFMVKSSDYLLYNHFNTSISENNVRILDPATGTGTFITEIIDYIPPNKLKYKFNEEIFANEVSILPYYVANLNIEYTFWQKMQEYIEFKNICFVDTLDNAYFKSNVDRHGQMLFDNYLTEENSKRIVDQNGMKISLIIGNPPYNANQQNFNDQNANRKYPIIDQAIKENFAKESNATKLKLEDMYVRFYRWAMDRIDSKYGGIIAFITNRSFVDARGFDGFRKIVSKEFDYIYIIDTQSDVRKNPKISGTKNNVFGIQTGVAVTFLVKTPLDKQKKAIIRYYTLNDEDTKLEKLHFFKTTNISDIHWSRIYPDDRNTWLNLSDNDFDTFIPICTTNSEKAIFTFYSLGVSTNRDDWVYDFSKTNLISKMAYFSVSYNESLQKKEMNPNIKWSRDLRDKFNRIQKSNFNEDYCIQAIYRPFIKKFLYSEKMFNDVMTEKHYSMFGKDLNKKNMVIHFSGLGHSKHFHCLAYDTVFSLDSIEKGQCVPLYIQSDTGEQIENITDWALKKFQTNYKNKSITKKNIFQYVYAVLHNPIYRETYKNNLTQSFPKIPFYTDFSKWVKWGEILLYLHINFESIEPYSIEIINIDVINENIKPIFKVNREEGTIILDEITTLKKIPPECFNYTLGIRSAIEWILDQYKEKKIKDDTVSEYFNKFKYADYKNQIIDLIAKVITVSIRTISVINEMGKSS